MAKNGYTTLNLPTDLVEELKVWKTAYTAAHGRPVSYAEMIRSFLDYAPDNEEDVALALEMITSVNPELLDKLGKWPAKKKEERA